jgi:hypothetical protein
MQVNIAQNTFKKIGMITEQEFLEAVKIIKKYKLQVEQITEETLLHTGMMKTPAEIESNWQEHFPTMSDRLRDILIGQFKDTRIYEISFNKFANTRNVGNRTMLEFCKLTGKGKEYLKKYETPN